MNEPPNMFAALSSMDPHQPCRKAGARPFSSATTYFRLELEKCAAPIYQYYPAI